MSNKILKYKEYKLLKEGSEFNQYQMGLPGVSTLPNYGFAMQPDFSIYGNDDGKYVDFYSRQSNYLNHLLQVIKDVQKEDYYKKTIANHKIDHFLEDIDKIHDLKILRIYKNDYLTIDVYISFMFEDMEFFGVFRKFNGHVKPKLESELFTDPRFGYFDKEYYLKISTYFYKILYNWFIPEKGFYKNLKDDNYLRGEFGEFVQLKKNATIEVVGFNKEIDNKPYIIVKYKNNINYIDNDNYYFFNYYFEKI